MLDKDLDDSSKIGNIVNSGGDIVQFLEYNSEYLLLKFAGKNPKMPSEFKNMSEFRDYSKIEFKRHFNKRASDLKDSDLDLIFRNATDKEIEGGFKELFAILY